MPVAARRGAPHARRRHLQALVAAWLVPLLIVACDRGAGRAREVARDESPRPAASGDSAPAPPRLGGEGLTVNENGATIRTEGEWRDIEVPFTFINRRATAVSNPGCNPPELPHLEWWTGTAWKSAYLQGSDACRSRSFIVRPGGRHADTLRMRVPRDPVDASGNPTGEPWRVPAGSWFRLVWDLREPPTDPAGWEDGPPIAERERVSAPFRLREATGEPRLARASREVIAFLRGTVPFERLALPDSVTFYVAPEGGGGTVTRGRDLLRDRANWTVPVGGKMVALMPPRSFRRTTLYLGQHAACNPVALRTRVASLAALPHVGVRLDPGESASCLQTWNVTLVFTGDTSAPRLSAVVYDQWEW